MPRNLIALLLSVAVATALVAGALPAPPVAAQQPIAIVSDQARNDFPTGVSFAITFTAADAPKEARLLYKLAPDGTGASAVAECTGTGTVTCTYALTSGRGIFIIPGAEITYHWAIKDASGAETATPDKLYVHEDTRFTFQTLQQDNITIHFHSGTETSARAVLQAAADT